MRFWDSSALVPLVVEDETTDELLELYRADPEVISWWGSEVECVSALARLEREGSLVGEGADEAFERLRELAASWHQVEPSELVRETSIRLLRVHDLRAVDSLQLAAAILAAEQRPPTLDFVCRDRRLARAAAREGFRRP